MFSLLRIPKGDVLLFKMYAQVKGQWVCGAKPISSNPISRGPSLVCFNEAGLS
jgi:hypothetical protein